jgi:hypothetical protein
MEREKRGRERTWKGKAMRRTGRQQHGVVREWSGE